MQNIFKDDIVYHNKNGIEYIQFKKLLQYPEITHCYTLRSKNKLNFPPVYKDEKMLKQSYKNICDCLNLEVDTIVKPHQTHTDCVERVDGIIELNEVDGIITNKKNITLLTTSADCTSLIFYDHIKKVIGNVHSGWRGTLQGIGKKAVEKMITEYNSNPKDIICCICPCIRECCFEVEEDVKNLFENEYGYLEKIDTIIRKVASPHVQIASQLHESKKLNLVATEKSSDFSYAIKSGSVINEKQKYYIDTTEINKQILKEIGLKEENIIDSGICTKCHSEYFHSYRAEKENSGRNAAIISLSV